MANSLVEALQNEHKVKPDDGWIDDKYEPEEKTSQIGFNIESSEYYYSPVMKPKKKRKSTKK
jgi:hypothetical protein